MSGEPIHLTGRFIGGRKRSKTLVNVVCVAADDRIAVVKLVKDVGPVMWHRSPRGEGRALDRATPIRELDTPAAWSETDTPSLWCALCGPMTFDPAALQARKRATSTARRASIV